ncbi:MAG: serine hydrolase domain-containing protein [Desulfobacterales bacterium]
MPFKKPSSPSAFAAVDRLMRQAAAQGVFAGAVLLVAREGRVLFRRAYGVSDCESGRPVTAGTVFDLASLTKPLATTLCLMRLAEEKKVAIAGPLADHLPAFGRGDKAEVTIAHLLRHTAGLPDHRPFFRELSLLPAAERARALEERIRREPLLSPPGSRTLYSDLGFLLLGRLVERVTGKRLDQAAADLVYRPLGLEREIFFLPAGAPPPRRRFAATERCPFRGRLLCAEVHDENAWALGGVAGHAGLFGTARGVFHLVEEVRRAREGRGRLFSQAAALAFSRRKPPGGRALGFDVPGPAEPSCGRLFSADSIGHLGFTGTSFWLDPRRGLIVVLLTNRVHPSRDNVLIRAFRPRVHDAVARALG